MKNYRVTVNGVAYDVVVEEISGAQVPTYVAPAPVAPVAAPAAPVALNPNVKPVTMPKAGITV